MHIHATARLDATGRAISSTSKRPIRVWQIVLIAIVLIRLLTLSALPILDPSESRYAKIAMLMVRSGDWIVPHTAPDVPFWGKPPLSFWLTAVCFRLLGISEFTARLAPFLMCATVVWCTVLLARNLYKQWHPNTSFDESRAFGYICGSILASMLLFYVSAGFVQTDASLAACAALCMVSIPLSTCAANRRTCMAWQYAYFIGLGLGLLAKGPVAVALVLFATFAWAITAKQCHELRRLPWLTGTALLLLIAAPWYFAAEFKSPGFLNYFFIGEHWKRFLVSGWKSKYGTAHREPVGTIWLYGIIAAFPWIVSFVSRKRLRIILPRRWKRISRWHAYLVWWGISPMILFTPARNIMITYIISALPAIAILCGAAIFTEKRRKGLNTFSPLTLSGAFVVPVALMILSIVFSNRIASRYSQKNVIQEFGKLKKGRDAELVYIGHMPYSAFIYSNGTAIQFRARSGDSIASLLADQKEKVFVFRHADQHRFLRLDVPPTREVARIGKYTLRQTI